MQTKLHRVQTKLRGVQNIQNRQERLHLPVVRELVTSLHAFQNFIFCPQTLNIYYIFFYIIHPN